MRTFAYRFRSALSFEEMLEALGDFRPRESALYGVYLAARRDPGARLRLFADGDRFLLDVRVEEGDAESVEASVLDDLLPAVGARDIRAADSVG
jgi:hypothetical protein